MVDGKETIYIDAEDEITGIIDKVRSSKQKIVALVLPKRAGVFHSIVNMKLLKRAADSAKKKVVLITSEGSLLPLAGVVGLHVAKTLQSQPAIPEAPVANDNAVNISEPDKEDVELDKSAPVGVLAGMPDEDDAIQVDNSDKPLAAAAAAKAKTPKNKKLKIPNFERFRTRLFLGAALLILLIVGFIYAAIVLPKAKITIKTDTTTIASNVSLIGSPKAKTFNKDNGIVPAENKTLSKTDASQAPATGQKNNGTKAKGTMTLTNCINDQQPHTVPAGTGFSSGNLTFVTNDDVVLSAAYYTNGKCQTQFGNALGFTKDVPVTAATAGDQYNLSSRSYNPPASLATSNGSVSASGSNMSGGTNQIIKIVSQQDVDGAKQKIVDQNTQVAKDTLNKQLQDDSYLPIADTFVAGNPVVTTTPNVGEQADQVNVSVTVNYTMLGVKKDDVKQLVENDIKQHIDTNKQAILDNGLDKASFQILEKRPNGDVKLSVQTQALAGVAQDADGIKQAIAGKKKGEARDTILARPGVKDVNVNYSPFWVTSAPKKSSKITVVFEQSNTDANKNP
jgi:hypothetical protein